MVVIGGIAVKPGTGSGGEAVEAKADEETGSGKERVGVHSRSIARGVGDVNGGTLQRATGLAHSKPWPRFEGALSVAPEFSKTIREVPS
jgi:hypothetical protein